LEVQEEVKRPIVYYTLREKKGNEPPLPELCVRVPNKFHIKNVGDRKREIKDRSSPLEGDADALSEFVEHGPAAVAAVDGRVDLDAEELRGAVRVRGDLMNVRE
jgi:hypothetical protein